MRFTPSKRRGPPSVIIVSLIDVLIVVLIFMMVASTFKQQPAVKLALPESSQSSQVAGDLENLVVTVASQEPFLYLGDRAVTYEKLRESLAAAAQRNPKVSLSLRADEAAPFGQIVRVMDAARENGIKSVNAFTKSSASP